MSCQRGWLTCLVLGVGLLALPVSAYAQSTIKRVPIKTLRVVDGRYVYDQECAVCHGPIGRGNGKAAHLIGVPVPDLTLIAVRDGEFNQLHVRSHIVNARTDRDQMPDWGQNLQAAFSGERSATELAVRNLVRHIEQMQRTAY